MAAKTEPVKERVMAVRDLAWTLSQLKPDQIVYVDVCEACGARILSFEGPEIDCPVCTAKIEIRPITLK
jgi:hypothetical protein